MSRNSRVESPNKIKMELRPVSFRKVQIPLKLKTEKSNRKDVTDATNRPITNGDMKSVLMSPKLVNPIRSHIRTNLRTFF
jgi:hypothetical protein